MNQGYHLLCNISIIADRIKAVELFATRTKLQSKLGSCDNCKWVSNDKRNCGNPNISECNVFTNSLFEPNTLKAKRFRFKYVERDRMTNSEHEDLLEDFKVVDNPSPYNNLPDGEYLIRGNKKSYSKEYWVKGNIWYLVNEQTYDNGRYICDAAKYELFPSLSEKQWQILYSVPYKCLSKTWQRYLEGHWQWMRLRDLKREIDLGYLKFNKERK